MLRPKNNKLKNITVFAFQTFVTLFIIPCLITISLSIYAIMSLGSLSEISQLNILNNWGFTIVQYQCYFSPILVLISNIFKWKYVEFWSVLYTGLLIFSLLNGNIVSTENDRVGPEFNFIFPFIYYELVYESSDLRNFIGLKNRYNVRKWFIQLLGKR